MAPSPLVDTFTIPGIILVSGPKGSGKTHFIRHLLYQLCKEKHVAHVTIISPTSYTGAYDYLAPEHIHSSYNEAILYDLIDEQVALREAGTPRPAALILDDCIGTANFKSTVWEQLSTTCRHPLLTIVVVTQQMKRIPPVLRDNSDTTVVLRTIDKDNMKALYDCCGRASFRTQREFDAFLLFNTVDYKCVVFNHGKPEIVRAPPTSKKFRVLY